MIGRRSVVAGLAGAVAAPKLAAQQQAVPLICYLALATRQSDAASVAAFRDGLRERLARWVSVFLVPGAAAARLVPVVAVGLHPRAGQADLFASLAQPAGMVTGASDFGAEPAAKRVPLLKEVMPRLARVGVLHKTTDRMFRRRGARPGEMPLAQATQLKLVSNLKAAKALGITARESVLVSLPGPCRGAALAKKRRCSLPRWGSALFTPSPAGGGLGWGHA